MNTLSNISQISFTQVILPFLIALTSTVVILPYVIKVAYEKKMFDMPCERKIHKALIPRFGGIAIFFGLIISVILFIGLFNSYSFFYLFTAILILFSIGIIDDIKGMRAMDKFYVQIFAAFIVAYGGFRLESLYGLFGIYELPIGIQYILTTLIIVGVTNAYNLIDGIDGLAGGIGLINFIVLGLIFLHLNNLSFAIISFIFAGSILGFLTFNFQPAKIFMGDAGSLIIGFSMISIGIFAINNNEFVSNALYVNNISIIIGSIMFLPVIDTLRVFFIRLIHKKSPFTPDKNHIHHILLKLGLNHRNTSLMLYAANIFIILMGFILKDISINKNFVNLFYLFH
ncbi:MAG: hypothetical protein A2046_11870 [Bacteroidetes bacterium GWA2_30_7]|nr:MAG: hypothetical protein A2046_11870 [Bacteroidetes bacterium GWA2_30_7]